MGYLIGEKSAWQKVHRNMVACGEWVNGEPAMVIFPLGKLGSQGVVPAAICLSALYQWTDPKYAARSAIRFCQAMGLQDDPWAPNLFIDVVMAHIDDVVAMPPENTLQTKAERQVVAEVSFRDELGKVREREVMAGEFKGQNEIIGG